MDATQVSEKIHTINITRRQSNDTHPWPSSQQKLNTVL